MKALSIAISLILTVSYLPSAQNRSNTLDGRAMQPKRTAVGKSVIECIYVHYTFDKDIDQISEANEMLQVGEKYIRFDHYGNYLTDSILGAMNTDTLTLRAYYDILRNTKSPGFHKSMIIDRANNELTYGRYMLEDFIYSEKCPDIKWQKSNEETVILGYKCKKATCEFRGRSWTAWYAPSIKVGFGPWKLRGLPGLILKAEDSTEQHYYEAVAIRVKPSSIYRWHRFDSAIKLSREKFLETETDHELNSGKGFWDAYYEDPINHPKPAAKHLEHVPFELE